MNETSIASLYEALEAIERLRNYESKERDCLRSALRGPLAEQYLKCLEMGSQENRELKYKIFSLRDSL